MSMRILCLLVFIVVFAGRRPARADEVAPELERADLRAAAQAELKSLVSALPQEDQKRLTGIYVAFDASASDPIAQVACDDDGDHVVLLSDAMLRLLAHVARAQSYDDANSSRRVEDYAAFLARSQTPARRLLAPPPGFYIADTPATSYDARLTDALSFVLARELMHFRAGDLACPKPTATKESGDDTWTLAEQRRAREVASDVYPGQQMERDREAMIHVFDRGRTEGGTLALLRFFARFETERRLAIGRFSPSYLAHHPSAAARAASLERVIDDHKKAGP